MGANRDPMVLQFCPFDPPRSTGRIPSTLSITPPAAEDGAISCSKPRTCSLPTGIDDGRFQQRLDLLASIGRQQAGLEQAAENDDFDRHRQQAVSLLADRKTQQAFDVSQADPKTLDRYGRNTFGWSLLMARQLVEAGVNLVQVNLGNNETWDTHGNTFPASEGLFVSADRSGRLGTAGRSCRSAACSTRR